MAGGHDLAAPCCHAKHYAAHAMLSRETLRRTRHAVTRNITPHTTVDLAAETHSLSPILITSIVHTTVSITITITITTTTTLRSIPDSANLTRVGRSKDAPDVLSLAVVRGGESSAGWCQ